MGQVSSSSRRSSVEQNVPHQQNLDRSGEPSSSSRHSRVASSVGRLSRRVTSSLRPKPEGDTDPSARRRQSRRWSTRIQGRNRPEISSLSGDTFSRVSSPEPATPIDAPSGGPPIASAAVTSGIASKDSTSSEPEAIDAQVTSPVHPRLSGEHVPEVVPIVPPVERAPTPIPTSSASVPPPSSESSRPAEAIDAQSPTGDIPAPAVESPLPPTGTLVVVQGIVHTTESYVNPQPANASGSATTNPGVVPVATPQPSPNASTTGQPPNSTVEGQSTTSAQRPPASNLGDLSPSSIEVLGTLLSVATAATAASLVTGTTDALFAGQRSRQSDGSGDEFEPERERTRVRAAWQSLRERLIRARQRLTGVTPDSLPSPREQMLSEMARAFNLSMGSDTDTEEGANRHTPQASTSSTSHDDERSHAGTPTPEREEGAERPSNGTGSFEHFLLNLQMDLRTALSNDHAAQRREAITPEDVLATTLPALLEGQDPTPTNPANREGEPHPDASITDGGLRGIERSSSSSTQPGGGVNWWRLYRFPPVHILPSAANGQTTSTAPSTATTLQDGPSMSPADPSVAGSSSVPTSASTPSTEGSDSPPTSTSPDTPATEHRTVVPVIVVGLQSVNLGIRRAADQASAQGESSGAERTQAPSQSAEPSPPFAGLPSRQAARGNRRNSVPPMSSSAPRDTSFSPGPSSRPFSTVSVPTIAPPRTSASQTSDGQGTPWHARAARMLRDMRSGLSRQPAPSRAAASPPSFEPSTQRTDGRTYLIFVIGGYYPPNHGIVTGASDLNSFEALWELADLLGQVKPPTATREDIEKSGLEIFPAAEVKQKEAEGKIVANCVDRCLICLDDYEPDDQLRLMACRHAYHKDCVDRWLEQGRNNCPTCRSQGVGSEMSAPAAPTDTPA